MEKGHTLFPGGSQPQLFSLSPFIELIFELFSCFNIILIFRAEVTPAPKVSPIPNSSIKRELLGGAGASPGDSRSLEQEPHLTEQRLHCPKFFSFKKFKNKVQKLSAFWRKGWGVRGQSQLRRGTAFHGTEAAFFKISGATAQQLNSSIAQQLNSTIAQ